MNFDKDILVVANQEDLISQRSMVPSERSVSKMNANNIKNEDQKGKMLT